MKEMETHGFRPADIARKLKKTEGAMSQYASGYTNPSDTVLELLRRIADETRGEKLPITKSKTKIISDNEYDPAAPENLIIPVRRGEFENQFRNALALQRMKQGPGGGRTE